MCDGRSLCVYLWVGGYGMSWLKSGVDVALLSLWTWCTFCRKVLIILVLITINKMMRII